MHVSSMYPQAFESDKQQQTKKDEQRKGEILLKKENLTTWDHKQNAT